MEKISEGASCGVGGDQPPSSCILLGFGCGCSRVYLPSASLMLNRRHFKHIFL